MALSHTRGFLPPGQVCRSIWSVLKRSARVDNWATSGLGRPCRTAPSLLRGPPSGAGNTPRPKVWYESVLTKISVRMRGWEGTSCPPLVLVIDHWAVGETKRKWHASESWRSEFQLNRIEGPDHDRLPPFFPPITSPVQLRDDAARFEIRFPSRDAASPGTASPWRPD
jgi:hypothetical protein